MDIGRRTAKPAMDDGTMRKGSFILPVFSYQIVTSNTKNNHTRTQSALDNTRGIPPLLEARKTIWDDRAMHYANITRFLLGWPVHWVGTGHCNH